VHRSRDVCGLFVDVARGHGRGGCVRALARDFARRRRRRLTRIIHHDGHARESVSVQILFLRSSLYVLRVSRPHKLSLRQRVRQARPSRQSKIGTPRLPFWNTKRHKLNSHAMCVVNGTKTSYINENKIIAHINHPARAGNLRTAVRLVSINHPMRAGNPRRAVRRGRGRRRPGARARLGLRGPPRGGLSAQSRVGTHPHVRDWRHLQYHA